MAISRREIVVGGAAAGIGWMMPQMRTALGAPLAGMALRPGLDWRPGHRIEIAEIGPNGIDQNCPHCQNPILIILPDDADIPDGPIGANWDWYSDNIPIYADLDPSRREGFGWEASLHFGSCARCDRGFFKISVQFGDAEPDYRIERLWWHASSWWPERRDTGNRNFLGRRDNQNWIVARTDTPMGPVLTHHFGFYPYDAEVENWLTHGDHGFKILIGARNGRPWDFARQFVLTRFDDLRAVPFTLGLNESDERARSRLNLSPKPIDAGEYWQHANHARTIEMMNILDEAWDLHSIGRAKGAKDLCRYVQAHTRKSSAQRIRSDIYHQAFNERDEEARAAASKRLVV